MSRRWCRICGVRLTLLNRKPNKNVRKAGKICYVCYNKERNAKNQSRTKFYTLQVRRLKLTLAFNTYQERHDWQAGRASQKRFHQYPSEFCSHVGMSIPIIIIEDNKHISSYKLCEECNGILREDVYGDIVCVDCGLTTEILKSDIRGDEMRNASSMVIPSRSRSEDLNTWRDYIVKDRVKMSDYSDNQNGEFSSVPRKTTMNPERGRKSQPLTDEVRTSILATKIRVFPNNPEKWFVNFPGELDTTGKIVE